MRASWPKTHIRLENGQEVEATAPSIISASRATDIPAFYSDWFFNALKKGYCIWTNPFNRKEHYISFENVKAVVFWSKNPQPIISRLPILDELQIRYYFLYSLNDYENEGYEEYLPPLQKRIETFLHLSSIIGKNRVLWRFDPLLLSKSVTLPVLKDKIRPLSTKLAPHTDSLIFSFIDINKYPKVLRNTRSKDDSIREFRHKEKIETAQCIQSIVEEQQKSNPQFNAYTCAQSIDLSMYNILPNKCIDDRVFLNAFPDDTELIEILGYQKGLFGFEKLSTYLGKDSGQRPDCGCIKSKDIGEYSTCPHGCVYCYANNSYSQAKNNYLKRKEAN